jgi:hypothetical protein
LAIWDVVAGVPEKSALVPSSIWSVELTIIVLDETVVQYSGHGDTASGEVRVVVHALGDLDTWWRVDVAGKKGVDVVLKASAKTARSSRLSTHDTAVTGLGHQ